MTTLSKTRTAAAPYALLGVSRLDLFGDATVFGALFADSFSQADELIAEMASASGVESSRVNPVDVRDAETASKLPHSRRTKIVARAQKAVQS